MKPALNPYWFTTSLLLGIASCTYERPDNAKFGYEEYDQACSDGEDNDYDTLIDCEDPDCIYTTGFCGEWIGLVPDERVEGAVRGGDDNRVNGAVLIEICTDHVDNDNDGQSDCGDRGCSGIPELCCGREFDNYSCSDGIDNDGNNYVDCEDFGCSQGKFVTVCERSESNSDLCKDTLDNDGDRLVDCDDPDCSSQAFCASGPTGVAENTLELCQDGIDNDGNNYVDCQDFGCSRNEDNPALVEYCESVDLCEQEENSLEECQDGLDNDGDGYTDCNDYSCSRASSSCSLPETVEYCSTTDLCDGEERSLRACRDGVDNDGDGYTDCSDYSCQNAARCAEPDAVTYCEELIENTAEKCSDGVDNDGNGYVDCGDFSCSRSTDPAVQGVCQESLTVFDGQFVELPDMRCSDGVDNDGDGFTDCDDWDCSWNEQVSVCPGPPLGRCGDDDTIPPPSCARPPGPRVCQ